MEPININFAEFLELIDDRDKENNKTIRIPIEEYMKLKQSYDEYQTKQYKIEVSVYRKVIIDENGVSTEISSLHTNGVLFPDDTHTNLTSLYNEVNENSKYVEYLENKCKVANNKLTTAECEIERLMDEMTELKSPTNPLKRRWI